MAINIAHFKTKSSDIQYYILSQICEKYANKVSISEFYDEEQLLVVQWNHFDLTCIIDVTGHSQLVLSTIKEGPFSLFFDSKDLEEMILLLNSVEKDGPKRFHLKIYETIVSETVEILNAFRSKLSSLSSIFKIFDLKRESFLLKKIPRLKRVQVLIAMLNQEEFVQSELNFHQIIELLSETKNRPLSRYLYPCSDEILNLIESQKSLKSPLILSLTKTDQILNNVRNEIIQMKTDLGEIVKIVDSNQNQELLDKQLDNNLDNMINCIENLPTKECYDNIIELLQIVEKCIEEIVNFGL